jgi:chemotaxis protein CheC
MTSARLVTAPFGPMEIDALQEVGNIAAAHASGALTQLVRREIIIGVTSSLLVPVERISASLGDMSQAVAAIHMGIQSEGGGGIMLIFPLKQAMWMSDLFLQRKHEANRPITEMDQETLCEIGNICICAYLNAISKFLDLTLLPTPPGVAIDMLGAVLQFPALLMDQSTELAIVLETHFVHEGESFMGSILFFPDFEAQTRILGRFHVHPVDVE